MRMTLNAALQPGEAWRARSKKARLVAKGARMIQLEDGADARD
ncbi:hypothetical protein ACFFMP_17960 [Pseudoroseomonas cervicalis]|nr:hypothetical protein [Pseudoroseomonas cervicalis]